MAWIARRPRSHASVESVPAVAPAVGDKLAWKWSFNTAYMETAYCSYYLLRANLNGAVESISPEQQELRIVNGQIIYGEFLDELLAAIPN